MTAREELSRNLYRAISQHLPKGAVIKADEIHESVLDVVLPALRDQMPEARRYLFAMMACNPAERERALDAYRDEVAHELAERQRGYAWGKRQGFQDEHADGAIAAADLIDPEVNSVD